MDAVNKRIPAILTRVDEVNKRVDDINQLIPAVLTQVEKVRVDIPPTLTRVENLVEASDKIGENASKGATKGAINQINNINELWAD